MDKTYQTEETILVSAKTWNFLRQLLVVSMITTATGFCRVYDSCWSATNVFSPRRPVPVWTGQDRTWPGPWLSCTGKMLNCNNIVDKIF